MQKVHSTIGPNCEVTDNWGDILKRLIIGILVIMAVLLVMFFSLTNA